MAEGFDEHYYHVPQQTRRDKLRIFPLNQLGFVESSSTFHPSCSTLPSLFDPSLIPSDLLPCATQQGVSKEEGSSLMMGFVEGGVMNGDAIHAIDNTSCNNNNNPFLYQLQNFREFNTNSYNDESEMTVFKPKPLSLSLSSNDNNTHHPLELNLQRYGGVIPSLDGGNSEVSRNSVPLGPFRGYASILKGSRFLRPAQQLLEELCDVGGCGIYATEKITAPDGASLMEPPHEGLSASGIVGGVDPLGEYGNEGWKKKCRLLTMLEEVYGRYRQYYQQIHAVITSFEYVSGLGNASPYASLAINAMSKHYRCLKNAITDQLQFINKTPIQMSNRKDESPRFHNSNMGTYSQRPGFLEHQQQPVWRPQRGLPERAVSVLRTWLFEHFLHPYPTDTDKLMLAKQTGLSRNQVSNWFINARVRLWKPMVEEIHILESQQQGQKRPHREEQSRKNLSDHVPPNNSHVTKNPSTSMDKFHTAPDKQARNEHVNVQLRGEGQLNQSNTSINQQVGVGMSMGSNGASNNNNSVSLTLGLHQNHGIALSEPFSMSAAQRFGVALQPEGYVLNGFESQSRHFGRDVIGGVQLLHDFVG